MTLIDNPLEGLEKLIKQIIAYAFDKGYNDGILAQPDHEKAEQFKSDFLALIASKVKRARIDELEKFKQVNKFTPDNELFLKLNQRLQQLKEEDRDND